MTDRDVEEIAAGFSALANPLRVRILLALTETREADWDHQGMSYSDLRSAVAVEDGGRFNYHLDELRDQFVRGNEGHYRLTSAGSRVVDEIYTGTFSGAAETVSGELDRTCPDDGKQLEATFENGVISVSCPDHGQLFDMWLRFNAATDRDLDELFAWGNRRGLWYLESVSWDVCPHCAGRFGDATFQTVGADEKARLGVLDETETQIVTAEMECRRCGISFGVPAHEYALTRPPTIAFLHDHGIDYRSLDLECGTVEWAHEATQTAEGVRVQFFVEDERLALELDNSLETQSYRRHSVSAE